MATLLAFVIGGLFAAGLFMMMRRSIVKLLIGLGLLSHAANLLIFTVAGLKRTSAPIVPLERQQPPMPVADPLPQALILTAIVISFGVLAFAIVLFRRVYEIVGTDDIDSVSPRTVYQPWMLDEREDSD